MGSNLQDKQTLFRRSAKLLVNAKHAVVFTGAGISTPSGIPDFRSPDSGLWNLYDPFEVASLSAFKNHPDRFFDWIQPLAEKAEIAHPNIAHLGLASMENAGVIKAVITQNIDSLHQKAGSSNVLELHGSARTATCVYCKKHFSEPNLRKLFSEEKKVPFCDKCGKIVKPDVVLIGEMLPKKVWAAAHDEFIKTDLVLIVGSSMEVSPANSLPELALSHGAQLIIINLSPTYLDKAAAVILPLDVEDAIGNIWGLIKGKAD